MGKVGELEGELEGELKGDKEGEFVGRVGEFEGESNGEIEGVFDGNLVGNVGEFVGKSKGEVVGELVGPSPAPGRINEVLSVQSPLFSPPPSPSPKKPGRQIHLSLFPLQNPQ